MCLMADFMCESEVLNGPKCSSCAGPLRGRHTRSFDYQKMLKVYMATVKRIGGITFVDHIPDHGALSDSEHIELIRMANELGERFT